jgi:hypothetical protein
MNPNPFTILVFFTNMLACAWHVGKGEWLMAVVWLAYSVAAIALAFVK